MGLDAASIGVSAIERAVQERQSACGLTDPRAYWELRARVRGRAAGADRSGRRSRDLVLPRPRGVRRARPAWCRSDWLPAHPSGVLRLLSLPCSTGEEPYSMAMALLDAGVPADRFRIDAVDISARALAHGRPRRVREEFVSRPRAGVPRPPLRSRRPPGYRLSDTVRRQVRFRAGQPVRRRFSAGRRDLRRRSSAATC